MKLKREKVEITKADFLAAVKHAELAVFRPSISTGGAFDSFASSVVSKLDHNVYIRCRHRRATNDKAENKIKVSAS